MFPVEPSNCPGSTAGLGLLVLKRNHPVSHPFFSCRKKDSSTRMFETKTHDGDENKYDKQIDSFELKFHKVQDFQVSATTIFASNDQHSIRSFKFVKNSLYDKALSHLMIFFARKIFQPTELQLLK